ncbi:hypothetical protein L2E82_53287 [Cichorium intybus]|nr:hypothetical protein L2E82_53753 [Cichorium intybus]KAI3671774.1 hypothetical protein L2E82_53287 [Cichorium intybus]
MLLPADQAATLLLALSRYRSVRISKVPSVSSLRFLFERVEANNMSITHRGLVRTEGQCPSNLSGPTCEATGAAAFLNEVYPNRISTSQIRRGLSSGAGRRGPGCTSDWHIGEWLPGFLGLVSCTSRS